MADNLYPDLFREASGNMPYGYQCRLACGEQAGETEADWLSGYSKLDSRLIDVPTGLGKTAAVVMAWIWNRVIQQRDEWPRRLVYCLPMRTLVEQTEDEVKKWLEQLWKKRDELRLSKAAREDLEWLCGGDEPRNAHSPVVLMGGEELSRERHDWDIYPEKPCIIIGTQDMLLSRALNRGYGMSRARWPMHFGLLNNDCLWVLDETQLMGVGVRTSAQLEGIRSRLGVAIGCATWWASATLDRRLLKTLDHPALPGTVSLGDADRKTEAVAARIHSLKRLSPLPLNLAADSSKARSPYIEALAGYTLDAHRAGSLTIVILNRVDRARELFAALQKRTKKDGGPPLVLVHSRFRPMEREVLSRAIKSSDEKIIVATQAIEAGVDISARTLITELAPWASLVQRFGRCNRKGEFNATGGADIYWTNLDAGNDEKAAEGLALPYAPEQLAIARGLLLQASSLAGGASPASLGELSAEEPLPESHLLRQRDLIDLFETTPDLAGLDIDVGRFIRDGDERDVQVFWREIPKDAKAPSDHISPQRAELVRVAANEFKKFAIKNKGHIWRWDALEGNWREYRDTYHVAPGQMFLVDYGCGGYSVNLGWTGDKEKDPFPTLADSIAEDLSRGASSNPRDGQGKDDESQTHYQSISEHTAIVVAACRAKLAAFSNGAASKWSGPLLQAALWHDVGKAHSAFQDFLTTGREIPPEYRDQLLAKSEWKPGSRSSRRHFRHELASALAWLQAGAAEDARTESLVAYLIAVHHGKIRLSLRAMPGENPPTSDQGSPPSGRLYARGVWQGDPLPGDSAKSINIEGVPEPLPELDLSLMQMGDRDGRPSWTSRAVSLRDDPELGLFRLAWLETILRAADAVGSQK